MALRTCHLGMASGQLEGYLVVVEIMTIVVNPIMACYAVNAEIKHMTCHESCIYLIMAGGTGVLVEPRVNLRMAIVAAEW